MLKKEDIGAAVDTTVETLKHQLEHVRSLVAKAIEAKIHIQEAANKDPTNKKFSTFKAAGGNIDDFFKGLEDRIGKLVDPFST